MFDAGAADEPPNIEAPLVLVGAPKPVVWPPKKLPPEAAGSLLVGDRKTFPSVCPNTV